jgi:putative redox protein
VLAAWAARYLAAEDPAEPRLGTEPGAVAVQESGDGRLAQRIAAGRHGLRADEPAEFGGNDTGPTPYDLVLAGLGACTSMTVRMYADRKHWPLDRVAVSLRHDKIHAEDCANCETRDGKIDRIERHIAFEGALDPEQRRRLLEIADKCPVHRTLTSEISIVTDEVEPSAP